MSSARSRAQVSSRVPGRSSLLGSRGARPGVTRRCRTRRAQCRACHDVALHREEEFKLHVRPALCNGVTAEELRALLIQAAVYAGVPAANAAFRWVKEALGADLK
jgi:Carboxymuconolactone decarboxylase family